ncbi:peptide deformylase [Candidatus Aerophobetes bacterium]|nr:peptide deformylase [Candidatus Aerophobetes bacterium]
MDNLKLHKYGDPILRKQAELVKKINPEEKELLSNMAKIMYKNEGIGLAAPQVGINKRIIIVHTDNGLLKLINPQILEKEGEDSLSEGCLSLPEIFVQVNRAKRIKVEGLNEEGKLIKLRAEDFLARVIQHEIDHLNGVLIIDYATETRKEKIRGNLEKIANHTKMIFEVKNRRKAKMVL